MLEKIRFWGRRISARPPIAPAYPPQYKRAAPPLDAKRPGNDAGEVTSGREATRVHRPSGVGPQRQATAVPNGDRFWF